jgi:hypothetical protein
MGTCMYHHTLYGPTSECPSAIPRTLSHSFTSLLGDWATTTLVVGTLVISMLLLVVATPQMCSLCLHDLNPRGKVRTKCDKLSIIYCYTLYYYRIRRVMFLVSYLDSSQGCLSIQVSLFFYTCFIDREIKSLFAVLQCNLELKQFLTFYI